MRIDDIIYFAPEIKVIDLDITNKGQLIDAFKSRIISYYLDPAAKLNDQKFAFASGVILMTAIEAIANYSIGGNNRIRDFMTECIFLSSYDDTTRKNIAKHINENFRNGLIHEGRIKNGCQFSYEYGFLYIESNYFIINPHILYEYVVEYFNNYIETITNSAELYFKFYQKIHEQFYSEIQEIKTLYT